MRTNGLSPAPKPPATLSAHARRWWASIREEYDITEAGGLLILQTAGEAYDRMKAAQAIIKAEGMTTTDRHGQLKAHPCCQIEQVNRQQLLASLKALNLDLEPLKSRIGRPSGSKGFGIVA
jgi:P27 family predicted phage terminase small subunit